MSGTDEQAKKNLVERGLRKISKRMGRGANRIGSAGHFVLKQTAFGRQIEANLKLAYGSKSNLNTGHVTTPGAVYATMRGKISGNETNKHVARGKMALLRTMNGPELNIVLAGIPFLIWAGVTTIQNSVKEANKAANPPPKVNRAAAPQTEYKLSLRPRNHATTSVALPAHLASQPWAAELSDVLNRLVRYGMAPAMALRVVDDEFEGQNIDDILDGKDLEAMIRFLEEETE